MDMQATTPLDFRVLDKMMPFLTASYGNPHSRTHEYGWEAEIAVENARKNIADLINAEPKEIIFQSGATESNNTAIIGSANFYKNKKHIVTTNIEHKTVLESCNHLKEKGFEISVLQVKNNGLVDLDQLEKTIRDNTLLVSIMALNNEIGVVQDLENIGKICRKKKCFFHSDAAQAIGKIEIDVQKMNLDLLSITAHKTYGPKGVGALYIRRKPRVRIIPIINGGGQERGLRSGTLATYLCVGLVSYLAKQDFQNDKEHVEKLFYYMLDSFKNNLTDYHINGDIENRYKGNLNISFAKIDFQEFMGTLQNNFALSAGAACIDEPSYVLKALNTPTEYAMSALRIGIGRFTTFEEVRLLTQEIISIINKLKEK